MPTLDPREHIDRVAEQELFRTIVTFGSPARILTVCDRGGQGKSSLLQRLRYNCEYELIPATPSCLIELDKLTGGSRFDFAVHVTTGFSARGEDVRERFENFNRLNDARIARDMSAFQGAGSSVRERVGRVVATATATNNYGQNIGVQVENAENVSIAAAEFTAEQDQWARDRCVEALFTDLRRICADRPLVVLLDGWERCNQDLRAFILTTFLGGVVLHPDSAERPNLLGVVIAGRPRDSVREPLGLRDDELRPFFASDDEYAGTVRSIRSLSEWDLPHIRQFMINNGCREPTEAQVSIIREQLAKGRPLEKIVTLISDYFRSDLDEAG